MNLTRTIKPTHGHGAMSTVRLCAIVLSLLIAQALGLMHGISHAPYAFDTHLQTAQLHSNATGTRSGWVAGLFAGHSDESTCQVFDLLSHGSALMGHAMVTAQLALTSYFLATHQGATPPHQRSLIYARGPPAVFTAS